MTHRTRLFSLPPGTFIRLLASAIALGSLAGCSGSLSSLLEPEHIDYKSAARGPKKPLEVPPDLTQPQSENRYAVPDNRHGTATASGYTQQQQGAGATATPAAIAPNALAGMRVERSGNERWLVVNQTPEALWPQIKDFWQDSGFLINVDSPQTGVMETDWAESRMNVPQGKVRSLLSKALESISDTGLRDKFRTRLERAPDGSTEVYISHRGAEEVLTSAQNDTTMWTARPSDPQLEAQFLTKLMTYLGAEQTKAKSLVANAAPVAAKAKLVKDATGSFVEVDEGFDRAWRRVGLALDRTGFTVEDRDRAQGLYFVRYVDQDQDAKNTNGKGLFSRLFSTNSKDDKAKAAQRYRVLVKESGATSRISVLDHDGRPQTSTTAGKILSLLTEQLK